ncbi:response regulator [Inquilinus sp. KBS0705]|nr:response regulator [Inquilinus sp. KBS0705]
MMGKRILVVDDDTDILEILTFLLTDSGYQTHTLNNGESIFDEIKRFEPDLVVMDVMLAGMDGREICKSIKTREFTHLLPVILMSGTHNLSGLSGMEGAPDDFVAKPFDINNLLNKIQYQLTPQ